MVQYIITHSKNEVYSSEIPKIYFKGTFEIVTLNGENQLQNLYIGEGNELRFGDALLKTSADKKAGYFVSAKGI